MAGTGWDKPARGPSWIYAVVGVLLTLVVVLGIIVVMLLGSSPAGLASATSTPAAEATEGATAAPSPSPAPSASAAPTVEITPVPTAAQSTPQPTPEVTPGGSPTASGSPGPSTKPTVASLTIQHLADCNHDYGYGSTGYIKISWTSTGATGVRISVDPPDAASAYGYGYKDEPANGSDWVPFSCGAASHLYVVTTIHTTGYASYRYAKVAQSPAPSPTP